MGISKEHCFVMSQLEGRRWGAPQHQAGFWVIMEKSGSTYI